MEMEAQAQEAPSFSASASCESLTVPGRLRCTLEARIAADAASRIDWIDVQLVSVPAFVLPLRGRLAASEAEVREPQLYRWTMAVAAKGVGQADLLFRFRAVVCPSTPKSQCFPVAREQKASIRVGH
jgi:hypothetical protein